jgi:tetratricopeptide (TPR) repeat protein
MAWMEAHIEELGRGNTVRARRYWTQAIVGSLLTLTLGFVVDVGSTPAQVQSASAQSELQQAASLGERALREGRYEEAIPYLEKAAKLSPGTAELHADLALAYYSVRRSDDAVRESREALRLNGRLARVRDILGLSLAESGHCTEAIPILGKSYAAVSDRHMRRNIGTSAVKCAMVVQEPAQAADWVERLRNDFPNDPQVLYMATHVYSELSTEASQRLLAVAPGSIPAHVLNAEVLEMQGKTEDAIGEYRKVIAMNPLEPDAHYELGRLLLSAAQDASARDEARRAFEEELKIDPGSAGAEFQLGDLARQERRWTEAIQYFERARRLAPQSPEILVGIAGTFIAQGKFEDARAPLEEAIKLDADNSEAHYMLSSVYRRLGREQDAAKELDLYNQAYSKATQSQMSIRRGMAGPAEGGPKPGNTAPSEPHNP